MIIVVLILLIIIIIIIIIIMILIRIIIVGFHMMQEPIRFDGLLHDVTKIQNSKLSNILLRCYFHDVLEELKTNFP